MKIKVVAGDITKHEVGAIAVNLFQGVTSPGGATGAVDAALGGAISTLIEQGEISGKRGELTLIHTFGKMRADRVLVVGLGKQEDFDEEAVRAVSAAACRRLKELPGNSAAMIAHGAGIGGMDARSSGRSIAEGNILGTYRFDKYKSSRDDSRQLDELTIVEHDASKMEDLGQGVQEGSVLSEATLLCRDMVNEPANHMTPTHMAEIALDVARSGGLEIEVFERSTIADMGMGAFLGVAQGSREPPKLIVLRYKGDPSDESNAVGLLGKGITFDTGGISIKPAANMGEMKTDMAGGASVISAMQAISQLRPRINVTTIVPATENMPGGGAQRPGDIVKAMNGKTIEIDNTDAEGRLVLADAVAYASSLGLPKLVDVATLTGAIVTALGKVYTGAFGNDQELVEQVVEAGRQTGERIWQMPILDDYKDQYKSDVADIKNTGGRAAGPVTGAQIIGKFAGEASWVHLDIAGTARSDRVNGYKTKGATGVPVRTLVRLVSNLANI